MRILGIDTSLTATGLARIDIGEWNHDAYTADIAVATVGAPKPTKDKSKLAMARRVEALLEQLAPAFEGVDAVAMEGLAYGAKGDSAWVLPWIWGEVIRLVLRQGVPLTIVGTSQRAKFATGKGTSDKDTVLLATTRQFPHVELTNNNEADALIVGAALAQQLEHAILPVTQYRIDVVKALTD